MSFFHGAQNVSIQGGVFNYIPTNAQFHEAPSVPAHQNPPPPYYQRDPLLDFEEERTVEENIEEIRIITPEGSMFAFVGAEGVNLEGTEVHHSGGILHVTQTSVQASGAFPASAHVSWDFNGISSSARPQTSPSAERSSRSRSSQPPQRQQPRAPPRPPQSSSTRRLYSNEDSSSSSLNAPPRGRLVTFVPTPNSTYEEVLRQSEAFRKDPRFVRTWSSGEELIKDGTGLVYYDPGHLVGEERT